MKTPADWLKAPSVPRRVVYLCLFGLLIRLVLAWLPEKYLFYLVSDDAYYYFAVARNWVSRGFFSADGLTETNGFHPLWLFLIAPVFLFLKAQAWLCIHITLTFSAVLDTGAAFLVYATLKRLGKEKVGFWAAAFYLVNPYGLLHTMNGLETGLNSFFLALLVCLSVKATPEWLKAGWLYLGGACGLVFLSRTDNVFAVAVLLGYLLWRHRDLQAVLKAWGAAALVAGPWLVYNYLVFGTLVQTSGSAYPFHHHQEYLSQYGTYFSRDLIPYLLKLGFYTFASHADHYGNWMGTLVVGGVLLFQLKRRPAAFKPLIWGLAAAGLFLIAHVFVRWSFRPWYSQTLFILTLPAIAISFEKIRPAVIAFGAAAALLLKGWQGVWVYPHRFADRSQRMLGIIVRELPAADRVGVFNSGFVQYFTDRKVINLDGLANNEVLPYYQSKDGLSYLRKRNIRWLVDTPVYLRVVFGPYFGPSADSALAVAGGVKDIVYVGNNVVVVEVLPEKVRPRQGRSLGILRDGASRRSWGAIPWLEWLHK